MEFQAVATEFQEVATLFQEIATYGTRDREKIE